jgi:predicted small lipoprotein YifL
MNTLRTVLTLTAASLLLCACGQKGPLYLPDSPPQPVNPLQTAEPQSP